MVKEKAEGFESTGIYRVGGEERQARAIYQRRECLIRGGEVGDLSVYSHHRQMGISCTTNKKKVKTGEVQKAMEEEAILKSGQKRRREMHKSLSHGGRGERGKRLKNWGGEDKER